MIDALSFSIYDAEAIDVSANDKSPTLTGQRRVLGLYVGVSGDVSIQLEGGATVLFKAMPVGFYRMRFTTVFHTSTTATNLLICYAGL